MRVHNGADILPAQFDQWWRLIAQPLIAEARKTPEWRAYSRRTRAQWADQILWVEAPQAMPRRLGPLPVRVARDIVRRVRAGERWWRNGLPNPAATSRVVSRRGRILVENGGD